MVISAPILNLPNELLSLIVDHLMLESSTYWRCKYVENPSVLLNLAQHLSGSSCGYLVALNGRSMNMKSSAL